MVQDPGGTPTQVSPAPNLRASADTANLGSGAITLDLAVTDEANANYYTPIEIVFTAADEFNIVNADTGAVLDTKTSYVMGADIFPADGGFNPGYQADINNVPQIGDSFSIDRNATTFTDGDAIAFNGIEFKVNGEPEDTDSFTINESTNQSMFETFQALADVLKMPQDSPEDSAKFQSAMGKVMKELDLALDNTNTVLAEVGARMNAVDTEYEANAGAVLTLKQNLSSVQDLDMAEAITKFDIQVISLQAAQQSFAKMQGLTLFNYL